ncbi:pre-B-cell leukemia transcription factor-interacting protein 1 isoform X1 [Pantherophis guttatus]|uniref:Pre-B-cell leukemia transcription factor-interacting protein 1 isoform X1 n=1 Tax=Pantherophis guttatus TaxID=94885 RepID=A0ABM3YY21_PANGU|nr:pre-B-cell leukemia transcription factor-interacting protein 1 isoform X1 [Pantherophis guttatus]
MAENSNSQELENNNWVITGAEAAPVEDLGFEASEETQLEASPPESELFLDSPELEEDQSKSQEPEDQLIPGDPPSQGSTLLLLDEKKTDSSPPEEEFSLPSQSLPTGPPKDELKASSSRIGEEAASAEADVEGLRRRKGRAVDVQQVGPELTHDQAKDTHEDEDDGLSRMKWLLAVLAVVGFGVLAMLGVFLDTEDGLDILSLGLSSDGEEPYPANGGQDWSPSLDSAKDPQLRAGKEGLSEDPKSLDAMGVLLDKLAKENQDIRLMQAELQAQKEELEILLQKSQDKTLAVDSLQQNLAAENQRLAETLKKETAALSAGRGELQLLREKVRKLDTTADAKSRQHPGEDPVSRRPPGKLDFQEKELHRLRSLLGSVRQDLGKLMQKTPSEELKNLEQRLGKEVDLSEAKKDARMPWNDSAKARQGKAKPWQKKHQGEEKFRHQDGGDPKVANEKGPHPAKKHQTKTPRGGDHQRGSRKARKPMEPQELWAMLAKHPFPAPQGCAGVAECAHREGLAAPVQKAPFLKLVQSYLSGLGWGRYSSELVPVLEGFFGGDGVFAHERIGFADFLDKTEDALEELARYLGVSEDGVDDFEDAILKELGAVPGRRSTRGDGAKERNHPKNRAYG